MLQGVSIIAASGAALKLIPMALGPNPVLVLFLWYLSAAWASVQHTVGMDNFLSSSCGDIEIAAAVGSTLRCNVSTGVLLAAESATITLPNNTVITGIPTMPWPHSAGYAGPPQWPAFDFAPGYPIPRLRVPDGGTLTLSGLSLRSTADPKALADSNDTSIEQLLFTALKLPAIGLENVTSRLVLVNVSATLQDCSLLQRLRSKVCSARRRGLAQILPGVTHFRSVRFGPHSAANVFLSCVNTSDQDTASRAPSPSSPSPPPSPRPPPRRRFSSSPPPPPRLAAYSLTLRTLLEAADNTSSASVPTPTSTISPPKADTDYPLSCVAFARSGPELREVLALVDDSEAPPPGLPWHEAEFSVFLQGKVSLAEEPQTNATLLDARAAVIRIRRGVTFEGPATLDLGGLLQPFQLVFNTSLSDVHSVSSWAVADVFLHAVRVNITGLAPGDPASFPNGLLTALGWSLGMDGTAMAIQRHLGKMPLLVLQDCTLGISQDELLYWRTALSRLRDPSWGTWVNNTFLAMSPLPPPGHTPGSASSISISAPEPLSPPALLSPSAPPPAPAATLEGDVLRVWSLGYPNTLPLSVRLSSLTLTTSQSLSSSSSSSGLNDAIDSDDAAAEGTSGSSSHTATTKPPGPSPLRGGGIFDAEGLPPGVAEDDVFQPSAPPPQVGVMLQGRRRKAQELRQRSRLPSPPPSPPPVQAVPLLEGWLMHLASPPEAVLTAAGTYADSQGQGQGQGQGQLGQELPGSVEFTVPLSQVRVVQGDIDPASWSTSFGPQRPMPPPTPSWNLGPLSPDRATVTLAYPMTPAYPGNVGSLPVFIKLNARLQASRGGKSNEKDGEDTSAHPVTNNVTLMGHPWMPSELDMAEVVGALGLDGESGACIALRRLVVTNLAAGRSELELLPAQVNYSSEGDRGITVQAPPTYLASADPTPWAVITGGGGGGGQSDVRRRRVARARALRQGCEPTLESDVSRDCDPVASTRRSGGLGGVDVGVGVERGSEADAGGRVSGCRTLASGGGSDTRTAPVTTTRTAAEAGEAMKEDAVWLPSVALLAFAFSRSQRAAPRLFLRDVLLVAPSGEVKVLVALADDLLSALRDSNSDSISSGGSSREMVGASIAATVAAIVEARDTINRDMPGYLGSGSTAGLAEVLLSSSEFYFEDYTLVLRNMTYRGIRGENVRITATEALDKSNPAGMYPEFYQRQAAAAANTRTSPPPPSLPPPPAHRTLPPPYQRQTPFLTPAQMRPPEDTGVGASPEGPPSAVMSLPPDPMTPKPTGPFPSPGPSPPTEPANETSKGRGGRSGEGAGGGGADGSSADVRGVGNGGGSGGGADRRGSYLAPWEAGVMVAGIIGGVALMATAIGVILWNRCGPQPAAGAAAAERSTNIRASSASIGPVVASMAGGGDFDGVPPTPAAMSAEADMQSSLDTSDTLGVSPASALYAAGRQPRYLQSVGEHDDEMEQGDSEKVVGAREGKVAAATTATSAIGDAGRVGPS